MTRALRPDGIEWPFVDGKEANRLELITKLNGIDHLKAHDALSDVEALIAVTKLVKDNQPQLYQYLLKIRDKKEVMKLVNLEDKQPFVYVSGRLSADFHKATVSFPLTSGRNNNVVVYDLRHDPTPFLQLSPAELEKRMFASWEDRQKDGFEAVPVKELQYNRAPAVAPLGVLAQGDAWERIGLSEAIITENRNKLLSVPSFAENVRSVLEKRPEFPKAYDPEAQLYDGFISGVDAMRIEQVRQADSNKLADLHPDFNDERLSPLLLHYKARNYPRSLAEEEMATWESWRAKRITSQLPGFVKRLQELSATVAEDDKRFVLEEVQLWAESIVPTEND